MENYSYYVDKEKDFQIERLANENERLKVKLQERDEKIKRLEKDLFLTINNKNNHNKLKEGPQKNSDSKKAFKNNSKEKKAKKYKKCQRCGVGLVSPKPGQKFCLRHQNSDSKPKEWGGYGKYKYPKFYQGGSPGGGKRR